MLHLTLFWEEIQKSAADARVDVGLRQGATVTSLVNRALVPQHPTSTWSPGERYRDQYRLAVPAGANGSAELVVRLDNGPYTTVARLSLG